MPITGSNYAGQAWVTGANPAPGREFQAPYPVRSGSQWSEAYVSQSDGGIGLNTYLAGSTGPSGSVAVAIVDSNGRIIPLSSEGMVSIPTSDEGTQNLLKSILTELKLIKMQLEMMTGEEIGAEEIDG